MCAGNLYGRGASDNKAPVLAWIHAVGAYQALSLVRENSYIPQIQIREFGGRSNATLSETKGQIRKLFCKSSLLGNTIESGEKRNTP